MSVRKRDRERETERETEIPDEFLSFPSGPLSLSLALSSFFLSVVEIDCVRYDTDISIVCVSLRVREKERERERKRKKRF